MNLPEISIRKPVTVLMVTLIVILFGLVSLSKLPVELYPNTSFGEISIIIQARGGIPPTEVESLISKPVEEAVSTVSNLEQLMSISKEGESTVVLSFKSGTDMDFAALEVREKFAKIKNKLPKEIEKPVIAQFQQGDVPVYILAMTSEKRTTEDLRKIVDDSFKEVLKRVPGVANVEVAGGRERKILVDVDQTKLASYGIPIDQVTGVLGSNNLNLLSGEVEQKEDRYLIRVMGEFESVDQIKNMGIQRDASGSIIRVKDVAAVKDSYLEPQEYSRLNTKPVVTIYVQKESTKNTITVTHDLTRAIDEYKVKLPADIQLVVTSNQSESIVKAIDNLKETLLQGVALIILTFFLFLFRLKPAQYVGIGLLIIFAIFAKGILLDVLFFGLLASLLLVKRFRSIIIVTLPIPVSVIATFIFMRFQGLTVNVMTLFGLVLGMVILVDNSIVVFENILKKREDGNEIVLSAVKGSNEMFMVILASTVVIVIVFIPLMFMGQELQKLYSGMAATIVISLLASSVCALSLVPMMCSKPAFSKYLLEEERKDPSAHQKDDEPQDGKWSVILSAAKNLFSKIRLLSKAKWVERLRASRAYVVITGLTPERFVHYERRFLFKTIRFRKMAIWVCAGIVLLPIFFLSRMGQEYLGSTEQNKFTAFVELPTGAKLDASDKVVKKVEAVIKKVPEVKTVTSRIEPWSSKVYVELVEARKRRRSANDIIESLRKETDKLHPAFIYFQQEEQVGTKEVILEIFGFDYEKLRELAIAIANRLQSVKGLSDTKIRMREGRPEMQLLIQKKKAGLSELTVSEVANQVHGQMRGLRATVFHTEGKEVETISRLDEKYRKTFKDLHRLIITSKEGDFVLLDQVSDFKFGLGPSEIWRKDKNRVIQVSANIGKVALSKVVQDITKSLKSVPFPENYFWRVAGDYPTLIRTSRQMRLMIAFVLILVFLVLASLFESLYQPFLIMIAVPLALCGATAALYFGPKSIGVGALFGMMMLVGIVVNHSIMLIDRINFYVNEKKYSAIKAAVLANKDRLRPILMTLFCSVLGLIPMAIDKSEGANLWSPLALTVIGGVVSSTLLTLMVTPAFYVLFQDMIHTKWSIKGAIRKIVSAQKTKNNVSL